MAQIKPLDGQRILHLIPAPPGHKAWFVEAESGKLCSQAVLCYAAVEIEREDPGLHVVREQEVVPYVCGGSGGLSPASLTDEYLGVTTDLGEEEHIEERLADDIQAIRESLLGSAEDESPSEKP